MPLKATSLKPIAKRSSDLTLPKAPAVEILIKSVKPVDILDQFYEK
jgi:hypothetical protein